MARQIELKANSADGNGQRPHETAANDRILFRAWYTAGRKALNIAMSRPELAEVLHDARSE